MILSYDDAWELSLTLRRMADDLEKKATELDKWQGDKSGYLPASQEWARDTQERFRNRATAWRQFARHTLDQASAHVAPSAGSR